MTLTTDGVPDLLQRFAAAPFSEARFVDGAEIRLQSSLDLAGIEVKSPGPIAATYDQLEATILWDLDAPADESALTVIKAWPVATLLLGTGTMLALDCERREIIGFLSPAVSADRFLNELLPTLIGLYREFKAAPTQHECCLGHE